MNMEESDAMSKKNNEAKTEEMNPVDNAPKVEEVKELPEKDAKDSNGSDENYMQEEEEMMKKKYGTLLRKKPPLISKDHERAFFDSADWALGKKSKGPLEALRPKLEPSPHHQARSRSAYARTDEGQDGSYSNNLDADENQGSTSDGGTEDINQSQEILNHKNCFSF